MSGIARVACGFAVFCLLAACSRDVAPPTPVARGATTETTSEAPDIDGSCPTRANRTDVSYVDDAGPLQRLDLYVAANVGCGPWPLVVWVHGGGWRIGDKSNSIKPKVDVWTGAGWTVASVNYRLTDTAAPAGEQVVAPAHNEDVAAALAWLIVNAVDVGIDPARIALVGHSAGAGIIAAVVTDPAYLGAHGLDPSSIACAAPLDTEGFDVASVIAGGGNQAELYRSVFGQDPARWRELSPTSHVGQAEVPELLLVTRGTPSRRAIVGSFSDAVVEAGGQVTIVDLPTFSHEDVNRRIGDTTDDQLTPALQRFLTACLAPAGSG